MKLLIITLLAGLLGVALTLAGLVTDAWLHAQDKTLAAREGVFTLSNPGHLLLAVGMALTCGAIFAGIYIAWGMAQPPGLPGRSWLRVVSMQAAALASAGAVVFALAASAEGHTHDGEVAHIHQPADIAPGAEVAGGASHAEVRPLSGSAAASDVMADQPAHTSDPEAPAAHAAPPTADDDAMAGDAAHTDWPALDVTSAHAHPEDEAAVSSTTASKHPHNHPQPTAEERACLASLTAEAKALTARLADYGGALAEGYREAGDPGRTHHPNPAYKNDGAVFDLARPESAIYRTREDGTKTLVGVLYHAPVGEGPMPCGNATWWHTHPVCIDPATRARTDAGADGVCDAGLVYREGRTEMLHLWFVPRRGG